MGIRMMFDLGAPDGLEGIFWGSGPNKFRDWVYLIAEQDNGAEEENMMYPVELLGRLDRVIDEGPTSLLPTDLVDAQLIDAIFEAFVGDYCNFVARNLLRPATERMLYARNFRDAQDQINLRCSVDTARCWEHMLEGRAVGRPPEPYPYTQMSVVYRLGYWTADEVGQIHRDLRSAFPGLARIADRRSAGERVETPEAWIAAEVVLEATFVALENRTGLITGVS